MNGYFRALEKASSETCTSITTSALMKKAQRCAESCLTSWKCDPSTESRIKSNMQNHTVLPMRGNRGAGADLSGDQ